MEITKKELQDFILLNPKMSSDDITLALSVEKKFVSANIAALRKYGKLPSSVEKIEKIYGKFLNKQGVKKIEARVKMVKAIANSITSKGVILTLPCDECLIEQKILKEVSSKYKFIGCESEENVYNNMLRTIAEKNLPISTHRGFIGEKIRDAKINQYSHLILDYCGQLGTLHEDIRIAIENNIVEVDGTILITLNKRISIGTESIYKLMEKLNPPSINTDDTRCEHALRTFINRIGGLNYAIEESFNYFDKTSMILLIVRRIG